ncbi:MAG: four helix bundle protein [Chitinophagaceae bacterium]
MIRTVFDLDVFKLSYQLAMDIFRVSRDFPKEERYSLTDQLVRSSRSIAANIAEGWGKRNYENEFKRHLVYSMGSLEETKTWLNFAKDCSYLVNTTFEELIKKCDESGAKIYKLFTNWKTI